MRINNIDKNDEISVLKGMLFIRKVEEFIALEYPKQEIRCPVHLSIGQEGIALGVSLNLSKSDWVISNHRSHAHFLAKGGDLFSFLSEIYGKDSGCCKGRGGSMHIFDFKVNFLASIPIVGSSLPIGAGVAFSEKRKNSDTIVTVYIGDAAVETGSFHETLNFVSLHNLPLMVVCENNGYSVYSSLEKRQPSNRNIIDLAQAQGIKTFIANGDDVFEVAEIVNAAKNYMLSNRKPSFIEFTTYRKLEHCGPNIDDYLNYRSNSEVEKYPERDPLKILIERLLKNQLIDEKTINFFETQLDSQISCLFEQVKQGAPATENLENSIFWENNEK